MYTGKISYTTCNNYKTFILNAIRAMRVKLPDMPAGSTNQG